MPNEEPKGPALPPKKSGDDDDEEDAADKKKLFRYIRNIFGETKAGKYLEIKGIIGATTGVSVMISYLIYNYYYYHYNIELNEMYFAMSAFGIFVLNGLLFTFFTNRIVKTLLLFTSVFHLVLDMIYIVVWVVYSKPYTNIKFSLFCGLGIGIIYWIYDAITSSSRRRVNDNTFPD